MSTCTLPPIPGLPLPISAMFKRLLTIDVDTHFYLVLIGDPS